MSTTKQKKQKIKGIIWLVILAIAVVGIVLFVTKDDTDYDLYNKIMSSNYDISDTYTTYTAYSDYLMENKVVAVTDQADIVIPGNAYSDVKDASITDLGDGNILTDDKGSISYTANIKKAGYYFLELGYYPVADSDKNIVRNVYINGEIPFAEATGIMLDRMWVDENKNWLMRNDSNQASPTQKQLPDWTSKLLECADKTVDGPLMFYFEAGKNDITLENVVSSMGISYVRLIPTSGIVSYTDYLQEYSSAHIIDSSELENRAIVVQAENTLYKSSATLLPQNDRTSPCTIPYHSSNIVLNAIGGDSWKDTGSTITWEVDVPKSGLYRIATRFLQAENRDFYSVREIKINGIVPFAEAESISFGYDTDFQTKYLGNENGDFYFYLDEGKNQISMTVSLGNLSYAITQSKISIKNFNNLYRRFTAVMSSSPDKYRDYKIVESIPDMVDILETEYYRLNLIMQSLGEDMNNSTKTREVAKMVYQLQDLIKKPDLISTQLSIFNNNVTAISEWMLALDEQPLELDYLIVTGDNYKLPRADGNFAMNFVHGFKAFVGSFTNDYVIKNENSGKKEKTLEVWIATSTRDQYDIAQKMVINAFADADFAVELKMVGAATVMPATLTGNGPDVAIQLNYTMPTNFAYRHAGYDISTFPDFEEVAGNFAPGAMEYFEYEGGYYALPDEMSFPVMFYRTDIFKELGLEVPTTWDELRAILPYLQAENMQAYFAISGLAGLGGASTTSTKTISLIYNTLLYQKGIELYNEDNTASNLDTKEALLTFKEWTEFYTKESFPVAISLVTRFRTGDVPILIDDYTNMNYIFAAAPEIDGQWSIAPVPGTVREDGTVDYTTVCNVGASMILKGSVEKNDTANEAWEFLKWWTSKDTQLEYSTQQKTTLGDSGNFPVGNLEAIMAQANDLGFGETVEKTLGNCRGVPQVPGGYISGRYIENSFLSVVNELSDPVDTLYKNIRYINQEIANKREEFGLTD